MLVFKVTDRETEEMMGGPIEEDECHICKKNGWDYVLMAHQTGYRDHDDVVFDAALDRVEALTGRVNEHWMLACSECLKRIDSDSYSH